MQRYAVYGACLSTDLEFPELDRASAESSFGWTLLPGSVESTASHGTTLGVLTNHPCGPTLRRHPDGSFVYLHACTGAFQLAPNSRDIRYSLRNDAPLDMVRGDVLGRVLAIALHMRGWLALHASAVAVGDGVIAFMAPKGFGKSTLSLALTRAGAAFVSDDLLPIALHTPLSVARGVCSVRLRNDSAQRLLDETSVTRAGVDQKVIVDAIPGQTLATECGVLSAVYVLYPVSRLPGGAPAIRTALPRRRGAIELVRHSKTGALLGGSESALTLDRATHVAREAPLFALEIARDFGRLDEVVALIASWHGGLSPSPEQHSECAPCVPGYPA